MKQFIPTALFAVALASSPAFGHGDEQPRGGNTAHGASIGKPGDTKKVSRTVTVEVTDAMRFIPANITVRQGETIRFQVKNSGRIKHEMVLGSVKELKEHAELMRKFPSMEHADPNQVAIDPGKTAELVWQFTKTGKVDFACLQPGHFEAGMKGRVTVK